MPYDEAIKLYYEKHYALREGDLKKLLQLKNNFPEIFEKENDEKICRMIEHIKIFSESDRYKKLRRKKLIETLTLVTNNTKNE